MNATTLLPRPSTAGLEVALEIELLDDDPATFVRVLSLLHRRRCVVTRVDFRARSEHRPGRLVLGLVPPPTHARVLPAWLGNLVGVGAVTLRR